MGGTDSTDWVALNADVVGYSALVADDLDDTSAAMSELHRLVTAHVVGHGGTLANFVGDSFMAVFPQVTAGLEAALAIAHDVESFNAARARSRWVQLRMGMDMGEVTFAQGNHHGDALNIAARIQSIGLPGGLSVSTRVYQALDEPELRFRSLGRQHLKNIPERVGVYEFIGLPSDGRAQPARGSLALDTPTVVVLPIHTKGSDDSVCSMADVIRTDMLHRLARMPDLNVADARSDDSPQTQANYMVESGIHQVGDRARVYAMLIDLSTMNVVKSHKWSASTSDIFELSEEVADAVARSIEVELVVGEPARLYAQLAEPDVIQDVYLGWYHLREGNAEGWRKAVSLFEKVATARPDLPYGHVLSAFAWWMGAANRFTPDAEATLEKAETLARQGVQVGDATGLGQAVQAAVAMSRGHVDMAMEQLEGLGNIRPTCDITCGLEGSVRRYLGQWEKSVELLDQAMRLTGVNKPWYPTVKASALFLGGKLEDSASIAEQVLEHQPKNLEALVVLAAAQSELGLHRRARATMHTLRERFPNVDVEQWLNDTPYHSREVVGRWKQALEASGVA